MLRSAQEANLQVNYVQKTKNKPIDTEQESNFHSNPERQKTLHVGEDISL